MDANKALMPGHGIVKRHSRTRTNQSFVSSCLRGSLALALFCAHLRLLPAARADVTRTIPLIPGSPTEVSALVNARLTSLDRDARRAEDSGGWTYRLAVPAGVRAILTFAVEGSPAVTVSLPNGKRLPSRTERAGTMRSVIATAPAGLAPGSMLHFAFRAGTEPLELRDTRLILQFPDRNGDGLPDSVERIMGVPPTAHASITPRTNPPRTSFQTGDPYSPGIAVPADAILAYTNNADVMTGWADRGYALQTMGGFRDGPDYVKEHPGEVQTDRDGKPIVIGGTSYYMVPTQARIDIAVKYFEQALANGSTAICPEEPEMFSRAGYSEAFKQEWQARYGSPWQAPDSSVDARWKAEQLKGFLERRQIEAILSDSHRVKPSAARMVAVHSPVTYYQWGIPCPHYQLLQIPSLQEIIGQVWTGTARSQARSAGVRAERTFEVGYLEYSSLYNLARGSGKRMWFLMDPVEDNPDRPMQDYHVNYEQTLLASLMFPQVDSFEVMPWPQRVYGRVPAEYATEINTVVGTLDDLWRYPGGTVEAGSAGIGTFYSDSMGWQRGDPSPSDYDGFYGLCLPLVLHGVPADVLSLDRASEPGYLDRVKALLVSYDFLKPMDPAIDRALADWVRRGGSLVLFGGTDAYNGVQDSWWRKAGLATPLDDLFRQLGLNARRGDGPPTPNTAPLTPVLTGDGAERGLRNRKLYTIDLTRYARESGGAVVQFGDVTPQDGWGAFVASAELRIGGKLAAAFRAGSELETRFLSEDHGSVFNGDARFADGDSYWVYRFDNLPRDRQVTLTVDMGNGFLVKAGAAPPPAPLLVTTDRSFGPTLQRLRINGGYPLTVYSAPPGATPLYRLDSDSTPVVWEAPVGKGSVTFAGIAPGWLTLTAQASRWLRALAKRAYEKTGGTYRESDAFVVKRGPYLGVRTLGREAAIDGRYVDLLNPELPLVDDPSVPAHGLGLLEYVGPLRGDPRVLAASGRIRARSELATVTSFVAEAPAKTDGAARIWAGKRRVLGVKAFTFYGEPRRATARADGDSVLVRYPNDPAGVIVRIGWR